MSNWLTSRRHVTKLTLLCSHGAFAGDGLEEGRNCGSNVSFRQIVVGSDQVPALEFPLDAPSL